MASEDKAENLKGGDTGPAKAGGADLFKQIGALSDKAQEQDLKHHRDKFSMTQIPAAGGSDKGSGGANKGADNKFCLYDSGKEAAEQKHELPMLDGAPEQLKQGIKSAIQSIQDLTHWVQGLGDGAMKEAGVHGLAELKRLCFGEDNKEHHEPAKMPDGTFKDFKAGAHSPQESAEYIAGSGVGFIKGVDHAGQGLSAGNTKAMVDELAKALSAGGHYLEEKFKHNDLGSIVSDAGQTMGRAWEGLVKGAEEHNRGSGLAQGLGAGEVAAIFFAGRAMPDAEFAQKAGMVGRDIAKMSAEELEALGAKRIETVNGRLPRNWEYAGQVYKLEGELGMKYPEGVRFKETGYPDFTPYAKEEVNIVYSGSRAMDEALSNEAAGLARTPEGYTWHHVEKSSTMQLVPSDLHKAVDHTGGVATSGMEYKR